MTQQPLLLDTKTLPLGGSHLIEASAGTGKTHNIVRIYLRLLVEKKYSVDQILVMTFTVAATAEIRNRLNEFLRFALAEWDDTDDEIIAAVRESIATDEAKLILQQAILRLDEAAIYTIHGFCKRALSQQAFFSGMSFNANMDADASELKSLASQDWYRNIQQEPWFDAIHQQWPTPELFSQHWAGVIDSSSELEEPEPADLSSLLAAFRSQWPDEQKQFEKLNKVTARSNAQTIEAYANISRQLEMLNQGDLSVDQLVVEKNDLDKCFSTAKKKQTMPATFALCATVFKNEKILALKKVLKGIRYIREHIRHDKNLLDQLDFNDLIVQLSKALKGKQSQALQAALLEQFPAALVDEFQDTDPDQYSILQSIYQHQSDAFLCMIGDPKQAIYGFRGGDVFAYLQAKSHVDFQWTMNTNYRSSPAVVQGYNQTFLQDSTELNPTVFGFGIEYQEVAAAPKNATPSFSDNKAAVQWVNFNPSQTPEKGLKKDFQQVIARWLSSEIVQLLNNTQCDGHNIEPGNIAILVRSYAEAQLIQSHLRAANLNSVYLSSRQNVFQTDEATALLFLLKGIWQFENDRLFIAALASSWVGLGSEQIDAIQTDEHLWSHWQHQFENWRHQWMSRGLMSVLLEVLQKHYQPKTEEAERSLTNRLHLAERLQKQSTQFRLPDALLHWFASALSDESHSDENLLRLESDDALIKIITMHGAKGLEYPIVFLPFISYYGKSNRTPAVYRYHNRENYQLEQAFLASAEEIAMAQQEDQAELIRLLYVAMTRAKHRLYGCLAPFASFKDSAIGQTLKPEKYDLAELTKTLTVPNSASVMTVNESDIDVANYQGDEPVNNITPATFTGYIERDWWLSSFSALTRHVGHSGHTTPDRDDDESHEKLPNDNSLRFRLTKGAEAGNLLHDALEICDFSQPNYPELLEKASKRYASLTNEFTAEEFQQWLDEIFACPLGQHGSLAKLTMADTLRESEFYFPMGGRSVSALSAWMQKRRGTDYQLPDKHKLKGMMHGFIDLIFTHNGQYFVADYKSTHLGFKLEDYQRAAMHHSVLSSSYDLQYAIYMLALHRYLKNRVTNYQPNIHLGGVYYLYLRGMHPDSNTGVFYDPLPVEDLLELDDIFSVATDAEAWS